MRERRGLRENVKRIVFCTFDDHTTSRRCEAAKVKSSFESIRAHMEEESEANGKHAEEEQPKAPSPASEEKRAKRERVIPPERFVPEVKEKEDFVIRKVRTHDSREI